MTSRYDDIREFRNVPTGGPQRFRRRSNQISDVERDWRQKGILPTRVQDSILMEDRPRIPGGPQLQEEEDVPWWRRIGSAVGEAMSPMGMIDQQGENLRAVGQLPMGLLDLITYLGHQFGGPETLGGEEGFLPPRTRTESWLRSFPTLGQTYSGGAQRPMTEEEGLATLATMGLGPLVGTMGRRLGQVGRRPTTSLRSRTPWDRDIHGPRIPVRRSPERWAQIMDAQEAKKFAREAPRTVERTDYSPIRRSPERWAQIMDAQEAKKFAREAPGPRMQPTVWDRDIHGPRTPIRRTPEFAERRRKQFGGLLSDWEQGR
jgi:hypothetical protein